MRRINKGKSFIVFLMSEKEILKEIAEGILDFNLDNIQNLIKRGLSEGLSPNQILMEGMVKGLEIVGQKYEAKEYFLAELIMAGETMKTGMEIISPYLKSDDLKKRGTVVIGTVEGDLHDIGKNIVSTLLSSSGFDVHDLGVDVPADKFIEKVKETKADVLALSALLTTTMLEMGNIVEKLRTEGIREQVKVILGGAPLSAEYAEDIGADAFASGAITGVETIKKLIADK